MSISRTRIFLLSMLMLLVVADIATTRIGLSRGAVEANPIIRTGIENLGFWITMGLKFLVSLGLAAYIAASTRLVCYVCLFSSFCMMGFIVNNNVQVML